MSHNSFALAGEGDVSPLPVLPQLGHIIGQASLVITHPEKHCISFPASKLRLPEYGFAGEY